MMSLSQFKPVTDAAVVGFDNAGCVKEWSASARRLFGYRDDAIIGRPIDAFYKERDGDIAAGRKLLDDVVLWGNSEMTKMLLTRTGDPVKVQLSLRRVLDAAGRPAGFSMTVWEDGSLGTLAAAGAADAPRTRAARILLVDDNDEVRGTIEEQLRGLGHEVVSARSGEEALALLGRDEDFDLLFTDVMMPGGMGGQDLTDRARQLRPNLKVLFASGYHQVALETRGDLAEGVVFLAKPYRKAQLESTLASVLA
jgi:PAS domain S-box-containing protein